MHTCNDASRDKSFKAPTMSEAVSKSETVRSCGSKDRNVNVYCNTHT